MNPIVGGAVIGAGASLASSAAGMYASAKAAKAALKESKRNRVYQRSMSNTVYQRGVRDLKKAGLNPMLAYTQGAAPSASGSAASIPDYGRNIKDPTASALGGMRLAQELKNMKAAEENTKQQTATEAFKTTHAEADSGIRQLDTIAATIDANLLTTAKGKAAREGKTIGGRAGAIFSWLQEFLQQGRDNSPYHQEMDRLRTDFNNKLKRRTGND